MKASIPKAAPQGNRKFSLLLRNNPKMVPVEATGLGLIFLNGLMDSNPLFIPNQRTEQ